MERYKKFSINEAKKNETPSLIIKDEYFISVGEIVQSKIKLSNKSFKIFLSSEINVSFLITSTNKQEMCKITSSLNSNKSCGPNSISTKVLHFLQDQISNQLAAICILSFSTGVFPAILKTAKVIPIQKRILNQKLNQLDLFLSYPILINFLKN